MNPNGLIIITRVIIINVEERAYQQHGFLSGDVLQIQRLDRSLLSFCPLFCIFNDRSNGSKVPHGLSNHQLIGERDRNRAAVILIHKIADFRLQITRTGEFQRKDTADNFVSPSLVQLLRFHDGNQLLWNFFEINDHQLLVVSHQRDALEHQDVVQ